MIPRELGKGQGKFDIGDDWDSDEINDEIAAFLTEAEDFEHREKSASEDDTLKGSILEDGNTRELSE